MLAERVGLSGSHDRDRIDEWMRWRNSPLQSLDESLWLEGEDTPSPAAYRVVTAGRGDSISRLIGTSDPRAIGQFIAANGMSGRNSTIYAGRQYVVPDLNGSDIEDDPTIGLRLLARDNARLDRREEERRRTELFAHRLSNGLNVWTGLPTSRPASSAPPTRTPTAPRAGPAKNQFAKKAVGYLVQRSAQPAGAARGAWNALADVVKTADFAFDLVQPWDDSARKQLGHAARSASEYARRGVEDPNIVREDLKGAFNNWRQRVDPTATPVGSTWEDEIQRSLNLGLNQGELAFDVGTLAYGGPLVKNATKLGKIPRKTAADFELEGFSPAKAVYLADDYDGIGHHNFPQRGIKTPVGRFKLPDYLLHSPLNVVKPRGISRGDFYELHYGLDDYFHGSRLPLRLGKGGWSGRRQGLNRYDPATRLWYGTTDPMKAVVGSGATGGGLLLYDYLEDGEATYGTDEAR